MTPEEIMKVILLFLTVSGAGWGIWWKIDGRVRESERTSGERIGATEAKADRACADLAAHKLHTAEMYVTKAGMQEQTSQIMRAIEGVGNRIDGLNDRLDRLYENQPRRSATRG
ncbi:hypothetical protein E0H51_23935 [Rhizobium leguminosarum bv. viciae]|uniref:hypothetical protein n=1 Tax=Rhizobium leguminosarum TaxID=384 RepID=UPI0010396135|nr:hypothetical protein [Rhizobium leguminosarum]TBY73374.1 hypothetical protein E0H51_23935 [Rhizobium leguminosarum bv. viciae]